MKIYDNEQNVVVIKACIAINTPVLLRGETGTGKTTIIRALAEEAKKPITRINLTGQTTREDLVGKYILHEGNLVWQDGVLLRALQNGHWILLDEINAALPEVLFVLQALLESNENHLGNLLLVEKNGEVIQPNENCRIFATCNPSDYDGVKDLNMATLSRFAVIDINPLSITEEENLLKEKYNSSISQSLVEGADLARQAKKKDETTVFVSTRDLEMTAKLYGQGINKKLAFEVGILSKCQTSTDRKVIMECFKIKENSGGETFIEKVNRLEAENASLKKQVEDLEGLKGLITQLSKKLTKATK